MALIILIALGVEGPVRGVFALGFVTFVPGWAIVRNWPAAARYSIAALSVLLSLAICAALATITLWLHLWHPVGLFFVTAIASGAAITYGHILARRPGVYAVPSGSRVIVASQRAGGPLPKADLSTLDLAAPLTDGTQITVSDGSAGPLSGAPDASGAGGSGVLVNINAASETGLEGLAGVGPVTANAIIQYRTEHGPFATVDDLLNVRGIGPATLEELRSQVTV